MYFRHKDAIFLMLYVHVPELGFGACGHVHIYILTSLQLVRACIWVNKPAHRLMNKISLGIIKEMWGMVAEYNFLLFYTQVHYTALQITSTSDTCMSNFSFWR